MNDPPAISKSQLRWQCRRGMRELDVLLTAWLERYFDQASDAQKAAFHALLRLPDPELAGYLLQGKSAGGPGVTDVVEQIRGHALS